MGPFRQRQKPFSKNHQNHRTVAYLGDPWGKAHSSHGLLWWEQPTNTGSPTSCWKERRYGPWQKTLESKNSSEFHATKAPFPRVHCLSLELVGRAVWAQALASFLLSYHGDRTKRSGQNNLQNRSPGAGSGTPASQLTSKAAIS